MAYSADTEPDDSKDTTIRRDCAPGRQVVGSPDRTLDTVFHRDVGALLLLRYPAAASAVHDGGARQRRFWIRAQPGCRDRRHLCSMCVPRVIAGRLDCRPLARAACGDLVRRPPDRVRAPGDWVIGVIREAGFLHGAGADCAGDRTAKAEYLRHRR